MRRQLLIKRSIDVAASVVLLWFLLLPMLAIYVLTWLASKDRSEPLFYSEVRIGWKGRPITIYKFRTVNPRTNSVNLVRRFMRRLGLDEMPQLWAILIGQMSFIGPRPLRAEDELVRYGGIPEWRRSVRPGLVCTYGLAIHRVQKGTELYAKPVPDAVAVDMDGRYVQDWSLKTDIEVLRYAVSTLAHIVRCSFKGE